MTEENRQRFGSYVRKLRENRGLSLRVAEKEIGISNSYLYQIERGERNPPKLEVLRNMADAYGVSFRAVMAAAGLTEPDEEDLYFDQLERAFEYVSKDKKFRFGTHMNGPNLDAAAKRFIVEMYEELTDTKLLTILPKEEDG